MIFSLYLLLALCSYSSQEPFKANAQLGIPAFTSGGRMAIAIDGDLWLAEFRGKGFNKIRWTQLTEGPANDGDPAWTADGRQLIYSSDQSGNYDLWQMTFDEKNTLPFPKPLIQTAEADTQPSTAPDGTIVWVRGLGPDADLWLKKPGQKREPLTKRTGAKHSPAFAPDGSSIAYVFEHGRQQQLRLHRFGELKDTLIVGSDRPEFPAWSPDGQRLVYSTRGQRGGVWVTTPGSDYHNLISNMKATATWTSDGRQIALINLNGQPPAYNGDPDWAGERYWENRTSFDEHIHFMEAPSPPDTGKKSLLLEVPFQQSQKFAERFDEVVNRLNDRYYRDQGPEKNTWNQLVKKYRKAAHNAPDESAFEAIVYEFIRERPTLRPEKVGQAGVSSAHPLASAVGVEILKKGGNVVDAAVAVSFAIGVVEPDASGLGGYGEMLIYLKDMTAPTCIEFLTRVPEAASLSNGRLNSLPRGGPIMVNIPGTVAGMELAWQKYGSKKIDWAELVTPAIRIAEEGFVLDEAFPTTLAKEKASYLRYPGSQALFFRDSMPLQPGDTLRNPDLAWTLKQVAEGGSKAFYQGEIARRMVRDLNSRGNVMTPQDMARYYAVERKPVSTTYRGHTVYSGPPPVSGGANLIGQLNHLEQFGHPQIFREDAAALHAMIEAWKLAPAGWGRIADPGLWPVNLTPFTDKQAAAERWTSCFSPLAPSMPGITCLDQQTSSSWGADGILDSHSSTGTTAFALADAEGNMVSVTQTLGTWGGNFYVTPGLGFLYNDKLGSYSTRPDAYNARIPFARNVTGITPTLVFKGTGKDQQPYLAVGAAGNAWINSAVYQIVSGVIDQKLLPQQAIEQPRFLVAARRDPNNREKILEVIIQAEDGFAPGVLEELRRMGHQIQLISRRGELRMGYAAAVMVKNEEVRAGGDPRRSGKADVMKE